MISTDITGYMHPACLAIDVHQATLVVSVRDEQGAVVMRATVATEAKAIVGVVRGLGSRVHVAFEAGTQAQWLHDLLTPHGVACGVRRDMAKVTLGRKIVAITLRLWKTGELWDATKLKMQAT